MQDGFSLGAVWEETARFFRAEAQLVLPVAFLGFGLPMVAFQLAAPPTLGLDTEPVAGPYLLLLVPLALGFMLATIAISALALRPDTSVADALRLAGRRLVAGAGLVALAVAAVVALAVLVSIVGGVEAGLSGRAGPLFAVALLGMFVAIIAASVRMLPVWAALADGAARPAAAIRLSLKLTRASYLRLLLLRVVSFLAQTVAMFVLLMPIAVVSAIAERLTGAKAACDALELVASGAVLSTIMALWTVYAARLYRRLAGSISGT